VIAMLKLTGVFVICLFINVPLTLVVFVFIPVMLVYAFYFHHKMRIAATKSKERIADINAQVEDTLAGIRVVKSFANADVERRKFAHANHRFVDSRKDNYRSSAYLYAGVIAFTQLITVTVIVAGGTAIDRQALDPAELVTFLLYVGTLIDPIRQLTNFATLYQEGITGFNRFVDILAVEPEIVDAPDAIDLPTVREGISFHNVTFRYRNDMPHVLENISLEVAHGEFVALVGPSGAGKTTLCSLIPRFYDVTGGAILVDGHDVRDVTLHSLRRNIGLVHQDVYLFAGTIAENIRYGKLDATDDEIIAAAKQANAHEFIMGLPDGYDTDIGQRGVRLSGGQKQRLSIARVFLKNPPVLIFDEATSSLDNESEKAVQQSLERLAHDRTTLVIAHRLSTIRNAQRIVVLTEDGIVEQGSHSDLLSVEGVYARLYNTHVESSDIFAGSGRIEEVNHAGQIYSSTVEDR
ncbi:MAG: ABC transporter ATP-binding protein, partial [Chloroflexota bacterium]